MDPPSVHEQAVDVDLAQPVRVGEHVEADDATVVDVERHERDTRPRSGWRTSPWEPAGRVPDLAGPDARRDTRTWQEFLTATMLDSFKPAADRAA